MRIFMQFIKGTALASSIVGVASIIVGFFYIFSMAIQAIMTAPLSKGEMNVLLILGVIPVVGISVALFAFFTGEDVL